MAEEKEGRGRAGRCTPQHCFAFIAPGCCRGGPLHMLQSLFAPWSPGVEQDPQFPEGHAGCWLGSMQGHIPAWPSGCIQPCRARSQQLGLL